MTLYFRGLEHNSAIPDYAYGHEGVPPTMSTLRLLREHPTQTVFRMSRFVLAMFGNSIARGFPVADNLVFSYVCGTLVLVLASIGIIVAWRRGLFLNHALAWTCLLLFTFLTAAFVCVGRVWRGDYQPLTPRYTTFGAFCIVAMIALLSSAFSGFREESIKSDSTRFPRNDIILWTQGLFVEIYLCVQGVNWVYGQNLMEEWRTTRMLKPPRVTDLRISALGREIIPDGLKRGHMDSLITCPKGLHASGWALASGGRSADAVVLGVQNRAGEWVAVAAATPVSPPKYLRNSTRMDWEFLALSAPQKRGEWEIDLPEDTFGNLDGGVLRAWAMDYSRHILYRLPGDQEFVVKRPAAETGKDIRF